MLTKIAGLADGISTILLSRMSSFATTACFQILPLAPTRNRSSTLRQMTSSSLLSLLSSYGYDNISFVVHSSALLRLIPFPSHGHMQNKILWESWGPTVTRWHEGTVRGLYHFASGQRCILEARSLGSSPSSLWQLWDFNPYRVRHLGKNFTLESEKASLSVETEPSCAKSLGIKEGVYSSLPFVKIIPKQQWPKYIEMGVYDDRICGRRVRTSYNS